MILMRHKSQNTFSMLVHFPIWRMTGDVCVWVWVFFFNVTCHCSAHVCRSPGAFPLMMAAQEGKPKLIEVAGAVVMVVVVVAGVEEEGSRSWSMERCPWPWCVPLTLTLTLIGPLASEGGHDPNTA